MAINLLFVFPAVISSLDNPHSPDELPLSQA
jgi:hypothetical protein